MLKIVIIYGMRKYIEYIFLRILNLYFLNGINKMICIKLKFMNLIYKICYFYINKLEI